MKTTLKAIKNHSGIDITYYPFEQIEKIRRDTDLIKIAYSTGIYGLNGYLFQDAKTGTFYKITKRSTALFQLV